MLAVHIAASDGLKAVSPEELAVQRTLVEGSAGRSTTSSVRMCPRRCWTSPAGQRHPDRPGCQPPQGVAVRPRPGVSATVARESGPDLDVHIVTHDAAAKGRGLPIARGARLGRARIVWGWLVGILGPALLGLLLKTVVPDLGLANDMLLFLTFTVAAALLGGMLPALASAPVGCPCSTTSSPRPSTGSRSPTRRTPSPS